jgi:hypothetical protein
VHRTAVIVSLASSFFLVTAAVSCEDPPAAKSGAEKIAEWMGSWRHEADAGTKRPPDFRIPSPPAVALSASAQRARDDVASASSTFAALREQVYGEDSEAAESTKEVMCSWFGWYVEDPTHEVPDETAFLQVFLESGLKVTLRSPPSQQLDEASKLFRDAIIRAKGDPSDTRRNEVIAAACSIPIPA